MAEETGVKIDLKTVGAYIWSKAKEDAGIITVGLALAAGVFHAGIALDSLQRTQDEQGKRLEALASTLSVHGATLNADHDILTVLCVQFRCFITVPGTTPTPSEPGSVQSTAPKPASKLEPPIGVVAQKEKPKPISYADGYIQ